MEARKRDSELMGDDMRVPYAKVREHACIYELGDTRGRHSGVWQDERRKKLKLFERNFVN